MFKWIFSPGYAQGVTWAILTAFVSVSNDVITKFVGTRLDGIEISFFRFFFSMVTVLPFMLQKGFPLFKTKQPALHFWRALIGCAAIALFIYSLILLPFADVNVLSYTQPLFFMPIAILFLREKVTANRWIAAAFGFMGILCVMRLGSEAFTPLIFIPIGSTILFAMLDMLAKKMVTIQEHTITMLFYFALGTTLAALVPAIYVWKTPTMGELFWLFCLGSGANLIQVCLFRAFAAADASALVPFRYTELIFVIISGWLLFNEWPTLNTLLGAALIIGSTLYMTYMEMNKRHRKP
ncbi:MAG: DMT family transporter [Alphaproteobacteria bacterium]